VGYYLYRTEHGSARIFMTPALFAETEDALGHLTACGSAAQQQERLDLLWDAVQVLKQSGTYVYIDAGHSHWMPVDTAVARLRAAAVTEADGFTLNVSNFYTTGEQVAYGRQISRQLAGKHFIVDTSRNGLGSNGVWCNPAGRALGYRPTAATGDGAVDAYLWIKRPGQSDGTCNGGPNAGTWWADYALGLAQRAAY
jgi:endoglucanase